MTYFLIACGVGLLVAVAVYALRGVHKKAAWQLLEQEHPDPAEVRRHIKRLNPAFDDETRELLRKLADKAV